MSRRVKAATGDHGADLILDMVGGPYVSRNYEAAAMDGRIVQIATLAGPRPEVDVSRLMQKRLMHTGSTLRPKPVAMKAAIAAALRAEVWPLIEKRAIVPVIHEIFPFEDAARAHAAMEQGDHIGKLMLQM